MQTPQLQGLVGPNGTSLVGFGGDRAWRQYPKGDIVVSMQWLDLGGEHGPEPCMCLFPAHRRMDGGAYVIPQRNAWAYADNKGNPTPQLLGAAFKAALQMGFFPDRSTVHRIFDAVLGYMTELKDMPSDQPGELNLKRAIAGIEAEMKINGRTVATEVF